LVALARRTIEAHVRTGRRPSRLEAGEERQAPEMKGPPAGVFVSLKLDGRLRGCIGTIEPTTGSVAEEVIQNAISAAARDPRFPPVREEELDRLAVSVDVLGAAEPVAGEGELDVRRYGVIVRKGRRSGLLLPDLEGVDTVAEQVAIARQKAGIGPEEAGVRLYRFEVFRYK
jgi:AmmeMemoRadiSam system protein A